MPLLTRSDIARLAADHHHDQVSIYLPIHPAGVDAAQDPIRFRNLLDCAEESLEAHGASSSRVHRILGPARPLLGDPWFWQHQGDGLAVFLADGSIETYRLPLHCEELVVVGDHRHIRPLLPLLETDGRFHVLALSQGSVRLFEATRDAIREIDLEDVPDDLRDVVGYDFEQRTLQFHTGTGGGRGVRSAIFHGHGQVQDSRKPEIARFLRAVDDGVLRLLGPEPAPLVLAGVGYVTAMYRDVSRHPDIVEDTIEGSPDRLDARDLHTQAVAIVEPRFAARLDRVLERYHEAAGTGLTTEEVEKVLEAARSGRVAALIVANGIRRWGRWGSDGTVEVHETRRPGDRDLLDAAAVAALGTGALVHACPPERVPGHSGVAAILRY